MRHCLCKVGWEVLFPCHIYPPFSHPPPGAIHCWVDYDQRPAPNRDVALVGDLPAKQTGPSHPWLSLQINQ